MIKIFLLMFLMFNSINFCLAQNISAEEQINTTVYETVYPAIVVIEGDIPSGYSTGSGCIIRSDGYILTSNHVVKNAKNLEVTTTTGKVYPAKVVSFVSSIV